MDGEVAPEGSCRFDSGASMSNTVEERRVCQYLKRIQCGNVEALAAWNTLQWARAQRCARMTPELVSAILAEVEQDSKREGKGSPKRSSETAGDWEHLCGVIRHAAGVAQDHADLCAGACGWRRAMRDCGPELLALGSWLLLLLLEQGVDGTFGGCCSTASAPGRSWSLSIMLIVLVLAAAVLVAQHALRCDFLGRLLPRASPRSMGNSLSSLVPTVSGDEEKAITQKRSRDRSSLGFNLPGLPLVVHLLLLCGGLSWLIAHVVTGNGSSMQVYLGAATIYTLMSLASARAALWVTLRRRFAWEAAALRKETESQTPTDAWPPAPLATPTAHKPEPAVLSIQIPRQISGVPSNFDSEEVEPLLTAPPSPRGGTGSFVIPRDSVCSNPMGRNSLTPAWASSGAITSPRTSVSRGNGSLLAVASQSRATSMQMICSELTLSRALTMESIVESASLARHANGGRTTRKWKPLFRDPTFGGRFAPLEPTDHEDDGGFSNFSSQAIPQIRELDVDAAEEPNSAKERKASFSETCAERAVSLMSAQKELHPWQVGRDGPGESPLAENGNAVKLPSFGTIALPKPHRSSGGSCGGSNCGREDGEGVKSPSVRSLGSSSGGLSDVTSNAGSRGASPRSDAQAAAQGSSSAVAEIAAKDEARRSFASDSSGGALSDVSADAPNPNSVNKPVPVPKATMPKATTLLASMPKPASPKKNSTSALPTMAEGKEDEEEDEDDDGASGFSDISEPEGVGLVEEEPVEVEDVQQEEEAPCLVSLCASEELVGSEEEAVPSPTLSQMTDFRSRSGSLSLPRVLPPLEGCHNGSPIAGADDESPTTLVTRFVSKPLWCSETSEQERDLSGDGGVLKKTLREGTGRTPAAGDTVFVHYTGNLADGTVFDTSRGKAHRAELGFFFVLGHGEVVRGWDVGCAAMRVGERANLTCRADYGYGHTGAGDVIPPGATLMFDVEMLDARRLEPDERQALDARVNAARS